MWGGRDEGLGGRRESWGVSVPGWHPEVRVVGAGRCCPGSPLALPPPPLVHGASLGLLQAPAGPRGGLCPDRVTAQLPPTPHPTLLPPPPAASPGRALRGPPAHPRGPRDHSRDLTCDGDQTVGGSVAPGVWVVPRGQLGDRRGGEAEGPLPCSDRQLPSPGAGPQLGAPPQHPLGPPYPTSPHDDSAGKHRWLPVAACGSVSGARGCPDHGSLAACSQRPLRPTVP